MLRLMIWTALLLALTIGLARAEEASRTTLIVVACRVDDLTGQPGRHDPTLAARGWRDLELHLEGGELQCKRERLDLEDGTPYSPTAPGDLIPLDANFAIAAQCARAAMMIAPDWEAKNKGWGVVAVGCPVPIMSDNGTPEDSNDDYQIGLKAVECPATFPGTDFPMRCRFDGSVI